LQISNIQIFKNSFVILNYMRGVIDK
jgi:hypothetical protein